MSRKQHDRAITLCCFAFLILLGFWTVTHSSWFMVASIVAGAVVIQLAASTPSD